MIISLTPLLYLLVPIKRFPKEAFSGIVTGSFSLSGNIIYYATSFPFFEELLRDTVLYFAVFATLS